MADLTPYIYHERQEGLLCAQHCINSLLQEPQFTAVDLGSIGQQMDQQEARILGTNSNKTSQNMDDTGFFSIQVIQEALKVWDLELINTDSDHPLAIRAKKNPSEQIAFLCNYQHHWFSLRRFGLDFSSYQWYNLDSKNPGPVKLSPLYLDAYLTQLRIDGYTTFLVVRSSNPDSGLTPCLADEMAFQ